MPNPTAPRAPAEQAVTSDRALALRELLDSAAAEDLSSSVSRFLRFLGHADGDVIELQALGVPGKYAPTAHFTHVRTVEDAVAALEHAEARTPTGSYLLFNAVDPAVATRAASGSWHQAKRGESTTDRDVRARRAVYMYPSAGRYPDAPFRRAERCCREDRTKRPRGGASQWRSGSGVSGGRRSTHSG